MLFVSFLVLLAELAWSHAHCVLEEAGEVGRLTETAKITDFCYGEQVLVEEKFLCLCDFLIYDVFRTAHSCCLFDETAHLLRVDAEFAGKLSSAQLVVTHEAFDDGVSLGKKVFCVDGIVHVQED